VHKLKRNQFLTHKVKSGDTLSQIAVKYGTRYKIIKQFNNLKSNSLKLNQRLLIPVDPDTFNKPKIYRVKKGDNLYKIAKKLKVSVKQLKVNSKNKYLKIGDKIIVSSK
jgi:membrane-bound lytic murein transglycosylase D